tara:strand:- start:3 stop:527 length:525 start_codon:yes stop_codon:yes gene_type:complete
MYIFNKTGKINICLVGLMGSGKTVVAKELGRALNFNFFDTDKEIENKVGKSINQIFEDNGEEYFRKIEEQICLKYLKKNKSVISLGGGSISNSKVRDAIKTYSFSIYLKVDINILEKRLGNSNKRPLLKNVDKLNTLKNLYKSRKKFYNKSDLLIENNYDKFEVINKIRLSIKA